MLQNIVLLFITMAADNSATGHRGSEEMNSFQQKHTHHCQEGGEKLAELYLFIFFNKKGNFDALHSAQPSRQKT